MADLGLTKGGFSGDPRILAMELLATENNAIARKAHHIGVSGGMPPGKFWILDHLRSFLVQSGSNRDRYSSPERFIS